MFLSEKERNMSAEDMLRTSGDVSGSDQTVTIGEKYAPHERRCFSIPCRLILPGVICSARAEMFLGDKSFPILAEDMLRTSGDVSYALTNYRSLCVYAPHERRCFLRESRSRPYW